MEFGSEVAGDTRGIGRSWQVKGVPYFSALRPSFVPSKAAFLLVNIVSVVGCFYLLNVVQGTLLQLGPGYWVSRKVPVLARLSDASAGELGARTSVSAAWWIQQVCFLQGFYSIGCILAALSDESQIQTWRPLFGSLSDAHSMRNFWGYVSLIICWLDYLALLTQT